MRTRRAQWSRDDLRCGSRPRHSVRRGRRVERHGDTWEWDGDVDAGAAQRGRTGPQLSCVCLPRACAPRLLFGGNRVLFGKPDDTGTFLNDTWIWQQAAGRGSTFPVRRRGPKRRSPTIVGANASCYLAATIARLQGPSASAIRGSGMAKRWMQVAADGPSPRNGAALAYDARRERVVLFGGSGASPETWEWDGARWTRRDAGEVQVVSIRR